MKTKGFKKGLRKWILALFTLVLLCFPFGSNLSNDGGRYVTNTITAHADGGAFRVEKYDVEMNLLQNRRVEVVERITVEFLVYEATMFYRSLPMEGARYENIVASCAGNSEFSYYVADNPDVDGFIDVNCVGNVEYGNEWTYEISYVMQQATEAMADSIMLDVVGYGWTVPLHDVSVTMHFPEKPLSHKVHTDVYGTATNTKVDEKWLDDKTLYLHTDILNTVDSWEYDVYVAGLTLEAAFDEGVLQGYTFTRIFTEDMWKILIGAMVAIALAVVLFLFTKTKREVITVVNVKAPDDMDPMKMGKWLDGSVNQEDITSMIYYFANKGYLRIDFSDQDDPELIACVSELPDSATAYEKTIFNGLFKGGRTLDAETQTLKAARVSEMAGNFYEASQIAPKQVPDAPTMYEKKSLIGYFGGAVIGALLGLLVTFFMSHRIGGGYASGTGILFLFPMAGIAALGYVSENYRYKWKKINRVWMLVAQIAIAVIFSLLAIFLFFTYMMTEYEKLVLCIGAFGACFATQTALSRTEKYLDVLSEILGFKEFIVVTEEDKIKFMLEENPELYYKVLPYAQVLGVTDEWEGKFKNILLEPPTWSTGTNLTVFDYVIIRQCLTRSMMHALASAAQAASKSGGTFIGRGGGGGSFGGFGGGGFGGGGGGVR